MPLIYDELRKLAAARMANESPDHALQGTALVHAADMRLVGSNNSDHWDGRGHFFTGFPELDRWYFRYEEGTNTFGGTSETIGNADADVITVIDIDSVGPDPRTTTVASIGVTFDTAIIASSFNLNDITLSHDGGANLITAAVTVSQVSSFDYVISGLTSLTGADGNYKLTVDGTTINDAFGAIGLSDSERWIVDSIFVALDTANNPLGSLAYDSTELRSVLTAPGNTQTLTVGVDARQTIRILLEADAGLQTTLNVTNPANVSVGSGLRHRRAQCGANDYDPDFQ